MIAMSYSEDTLNPNKAVQPAKPASSSDGSDGGDNPIFGVGCLVPAPGPSRWEDPREAIDRILGDHRELILTTFPGGHQAHILETPILIENLRNWAANPELKGMSPNMRKEIEAMRARMPELRVSPVVPLFHVWEKGSPGKDEGLSNIIAHSSEPIWVRLGPGIDGLLLAGETLFAERSVIRFNVLVTGRGLGPIPINEAIERLLRAVRDANRTSRTIRIYGQDEGIVIPEQSWTTWDKVFLNPRAAADIREDLEFFINNEAEFRKAEIPYKRGYLLYGAPGNGKSTVCRAIATAMPFASFAFDFSNPDYGNKELSAAFRWAASNAPSVFFLEDIDRIWANMGDQERENRSGVTLDHLLNCIDGIAMYDGLVVVATANNPRSLDQAILSRPGRFDAVVELGPPDFDLRLSYLEWLFRKTSLDRRALSRTAEITEGVSMSYIKEVFILSVKSAIKNKREVTIEDVRVAVDRVVGMFEGVSASNRRKTGFAEVPQKAKDGLSS